ncbi:hypothetical protein K435DRAFT_580168, partial [Dendrothele bispora CBS 962.96]
LRRTAAPGGGSRSITKIAKELFGKLFRNLCHNDREMVLNAQYHERRWTNDHQSLRILSTDCIHLSHGTKDGRVLPCAKCLSLSKDRVFKKALSVPMPTEENYKYTNRYFRNQILGDHYVNVKGLKTLIEAADGGSPFVEFALGALSGKYDGHEVFLGLVRAMVQKVDRDERGVGMQNFLYAPAWDEFVHIVS